MQASLDSLRSGNPARRFKDFMGSTLAIAASSARPRSRAAKPVLASSSPRSLFPALCPQQLATPGACEDSETGTRGRLMRHPLGSSYPASTVRRSR